MPQATLEQIRIARVARRAREAGDRDTYERAVSMLRRSVVGDGWAFGPAVSRESAASPGTSIAAPSSADASSALRGQIEALRRDVSSWRWPQATIDWADAQARPQDARRRLQAVRELARDNVLEGVSRANRALRSGDLELARATYDRALARWGRFIRQEGDIGRQVAEDSRGWGDRVDDALRDFERDVDEFGNRLSDGIQSAILPLALGVLAAALLLR